VTQLNDPKAPSAIIDTSDAPDLFAHVYSRSVKGRFRNLKWQTVGLLLAIYYAVPWIRWNRGLGAPSQAVLIDIPGARAHIFGIEIWPQEVYYITGVMILAALGLFLVTSMFGRLWCGYGCPQTVWTDLFLFIERRVEGDRNARIKLDKAPWTAAKFAKKVAKHAAWLAISVLTGGAFVLYFVDAPTAVPELVTGQGSFALYACIGTLTMTTYLLAGWSREQVCTYMCPWPRIQAPMLDEHSVIVSYDVVRGEKRGHAKIGQSFEGRGHCVDCSLCVQVCPTGIDIRNGLQMACIGCGLCVDACNGVMERFGLPKNLVGWTSLSALNVPAEQRQPPKLLRPRVFVYLGLMAAVILVMGLGIANRASLELNVLRDRSPVFVRMSDGTIRNAFTVKVINKERTTRAVDLRVSGLNDASLSVIGADGNGPVLHLQVGPDAVDTYRVFVSEAVDEARPSSRPIAFEARDVANKEAAEHSSVFITREGD
jgi:cytochrome c oxidase accessory protein FixG